MNTWLPFFGETARPSRPPSPSVVATFGTLPISVFLPSRVALNTLNESRSLISAVLPSGSQATPHGIVQPSDTVLTLDGAPPSPPALVFAVTALLAAETLPAASLALTVSVKLV